MGDALTMDEVVDLDLYAPWEMDFPNHSNIRVSPCDYCDDIDTECPPVCKRSLLRRPIQYILTHAAHTLLVPDATDPQLKDQMNTYYQQLAINSSHTENNTDDEALTWSFPALVHDQRTNFRNLIYDLSGDIIQELSIDTALKLRVSGLGNTDKCVVDPYLVSAIAVAALHLIIKHEITSLNWLLSSDNSLVRLARRRKPTQTIDVEECKWHLAPSDLQQLYFSKPLHERNVAISLQTDSPAPAPSKYSRHSSFNFPPTHEWLTSRTTDANPNIQLSHISIELKNCSLATPAVPAVPSSCLTCSLLPSPPAAATTTPLQLDTWPIKNMLYEIAVQSLPLLFYNGSPEWTTVEYLALNRIPNVHRGQIILNRVTLEANKIKFFTFLQKRMTSDTLLLCSHLLNHGTADDSTKRRLVLAVITATVAFLWANTNIQTTILHLDPQSKKLAYKIKDEETAGLYSTLLDITMFSDYGTHPIFERKWQSLHVFHDPNRRRVIPFEL